MNKIYQGESLNLVFCCKQPDGTAADLRNTQISVMLNNSFGDTIYRFSTLPLEDAKEITVDTNYIICRLDKQDMSGLSGPHILEVKITKGDLVMIDRVKGIKIYPSVIGEDTIL